MAKKKGWSDQDKKVVKNAFARAEKRAQAELLERFRGLEPRDLNELWSVELLVRAWRKEYQTQPIGFCYETAEKSIKRLLAKGWVHEADIQSLSEERRKRVLGKE